MPNIKKRFPIYSKILYLYPKAYRRKYSAQMLQTMADLIDNEGSTLPRRFKIWLRATPDLIKTIAAENLRAIDAKKFVPRSLIVSFVMIIPLIVLLASPIFLDSETMADGNSFINRFYSPIFIILFPLISAMLSITGLVVWSINRQKNTPVKIYKVRPSIVGLSIISVICCAFLIFLSGSWIIGAQQTKKERNASTEYQLKNPTLACKIMPINDAQNIAGNKIYLDNNVFTANPEFSGIMSDGKDIDTTQCTYLKGNFLGVISNVRTPKTSESTTQLKDSFFTNVGSGEKPITLNGLNGFYSYDTMVFRQVNGNKIGSANIRLWVNNHWLDATASTFEQADKAIAVMSENLNKYLADQQNTTESPPNDITSLTEAERMAITQAVQNQEPTITAGTSYTVNINDIKGKQITGTFRYENGIYGTFAVEKKHGQWQIVSYAKI